MMHPSGAVHISDLIDFGNLLDRYTRSLIHWGVVRGGSGQVGSGRVGLGWVRLGWVLMFVSNQLPPFSV